MLLVKMIGKVFLIPIWLLLVISGIIVKLVVHIIAVAKIFILFGLIALMIGTIFCYRDWIHIAFLLCLIVTTVLIMYGSVFVEVVIDSLRSKIETLFLT